MLAKIAVTLLVLVAAWVLLFRRPPRRRRAGAEGARPALALSRCPSCGIWRLPDSACRCGSGPTTPAPRRPDRGDGDAAG